MLRGAPLIHEVQDLWPEWSTSGEMGIRSESPAYRILQAQEKMIYHRARIVTTISEGFKKRLAGKGVPEAKIRVIPNWGNEVNFRPVAPDRALGKREGLNGRFNVIYGGNIGTAQGLDVILAAARLLRDLPAVQFVMIGDGVERASLTAAAEEQGLSNVRFLGSKSPDQMAHYFAHADVLLIHLLQNPLYEITIPSKTYAYLASGRPVLAALAGETAQLIRRLEAGITCPPGNPAALAEAVRDIYSRGESERRRMGDAARAAFLREFSRQSLVDCYESVFREALDVRG
jgi:glycosyltransferase involved in cell wall biosynthesis